MFRPTCSLRCTIAATLVLTGLGGSAARAIVVPAPSTSPVAQRAKTEPALSPTRDLLAMDQALQSPPGSVASAWNAFAAATSGQWNAIVDARSGLVEIAEGSGLPWIPGRGNDLMLADLDQFTRGASSIDRATLERLARTFLADHPDLFGTSNRILTLREGSGQVADYFWNIEFDVLTREGLPIEHARVFFRVNNGNLVQFGAERVPNPREQLPAVLLPREEAERALLAYLDGVTGNLPLVREPELLAITAQPSTASQAYDIGDGYRLIPVWRITFRHGTGHETWQAQVDARNATVLELRDTNAYAQVTGGYWPVSWRVDGVQQAQVSTGWPFTTVNGAGGGTTNTSGVYTYGGGTTSGRNLGQFVSINDNCTGSPANVNSDGSGNIDLGTYGPAGPGDCTTQVGALDNTPSARQQYWHLNKIKEKARTYLSGVPTANTWLNALLTANVNINDTCNAFWNGSTVNFYRSGGGCGNTGEDAGVSMHEWGHGMDSNDGNGSSLENGTGETYGDFTAALQTHDSCVGQGFLGGNCGGYSNACTQCDGVRDIDWGSHTADVPWAVNTFTRTNCPADASYIGPCGNREGHCESYVSSGALFDFAAFDLQQGCSGRNVSQPGYIDYNCAGAALPTSGNTGSGGPYAAGGAWLVADRLWYLSRPSANQAFTCSTAAIPWTSNGCNAGSNWKTMRAVDDDDGNLANGTPHSCQLAAAFNRQGIACTTDPSWNICFAGCTAPAAPVLNGSSGNNAVQLSWANPSPDVVDVFRNEVGCSAGFTKIADSVLASGYADTAVANGTTYYYQVLQHPIGNESCGSAPSACIAVTPAAQPSARYVDGSATLLGITTSNDGDEFVDNCESGEIEIALVNDGNAALTNVAYTITSPDPLIVDTAMPVNVGALALGAQTTSSFEFTVDGAACAASVDFDVAVTATQMSGSNLGSFSFGTIEQDWGTAGNQTHNFEGTADGWTLVGFGLDNTTAASGTRSLHSSTLTNGACDRATSPTFRIGAGATSVTISVRWDIENQSGGNWWDKANVHAVRLSNGQHTLLTPTGATYNAGVSGDPVCHVTADAGWGNNNAGAWQDAVFNLAGLVAGEAYQIEVNYNTDGTLTGSSGAVPGDGLWFDNVRFVNVSFLGCDGGDDNCGPCTPPAAPTNLVAQALVGGQVDLSWTAVVPAPTQYRILRATTPGGPYTLVGSVGGGVTSYADTSVVAGTTYYYVVRAFTGCESANSNEDSATPFPADCTTPPTFGGLTSVASFPGSTCGLRLAWNAGTNACGSEPLVYNVYRSTDSGFTPGPASLYASCVPGTSFDDTVVSGGTTYYYVVRAEDAEVTGTGPCRDGNTDTNTTRVSGVAGAPTTSTLYTNNFETGTGLSDWSVGTFGGSAGSADWRGIRACTAASGTDIFRFGGNANCTANYAINNFSYASPLGATGISVPAGAVNTRLTFQHRREYESGFDGGALALSLDGTNYTVLAGASLTGAGYNGTVSASCPPTGAAGLPIFTGVAGSFVATTANLDATCNTITAGSGGCAGQTLRIAFASITDCSTNSDGWFLDDVTVLADIPGSCTSLAAPVAFLTATSTSTQNVLEWLNADGGPTTDTMLRFRTDGVAPTSTSDGTLLATVSGAGGAHGTFTHSALSNGTTYSYSAFRNDGAGNYSGRRTVAARPFDTTGATKWAYSTGATALAPPGIGSVYGISNDRVVHSMESPAGPSSGQWPSSWEPFVMNAPAQSRPPIVPLSLGGASKVAFVGSQDGRVYALNANTGAAIWTSPVLGDMVQGAPGGIFTAFGGAHDLVLIGSRNSSSANTFYGLNLADGTVAWSFTNGGGGAAIGVIGGTPSVDWTNLRVYFASRARGSGSNNTVWCLSFNAGSASLLWARAIGDVDSSLILDGTTVYVGTNSGEVHALDAATGANLWAAPFATNDGAVKGYLWPRPSTNQLYFATNTKVWAVVDNGATASELWQLASIPNPSTPLVSVLSPWAWVGGSDGRLYQLDLSSGSAPSPTSVQLEPGSITIGSPALSVVEGRAYAGSESGRIYAVAVPF